MNEEEKKAIENIEHIIKHWQPPKEDKLATIEYKSIKKLYEIYNKQQKEIEELKKDKYLYNSETGEITKIKSNSISKYKIMEIAKEYIEDETINLHGFYMKVMRLLEE